MPSPYDHFFEESERLKRFLETKEEELLSGKKGDAVYTSLNKLKREFSFLSRNYIRTCLEKYGWKRWSKNSSNDTYYKSRDEIQI